MENPVNLSALYLDPRFQFMFTTQNEKLVAQGNLKNYQDLILTSESSNISDNKESTNQDTDINEKDNLPKHPKIPQYLL